MAEHTSTRIAEILTEAMQDQGLTIKDLSQRAGVTYEHIRRIVRGEGLPAGPLLRVLGDELGLDIKELTQYASADNIEKKFGDVPAILSGKNPELAGIERAWTHLNEAQKNDLTGLAREWARRNRQSS